MNGQQRRGHLVGHDIEDVGLLGRHDGCEIDAKMKSDVNQKGRAGDVI